MIDGLENVSDGECAKRLGLFHTTSRVKVNEPPAVMPTVVVFTPLAPPTLHLRSVEARSVLV